MTKDTKLPEKWQQEKKALKAVQVAFDLGTEIQLQIRREAVDRGINPSDRVRQILGLPVHRKPQRLRLSISLTDDDFLYLAEKFSIDPSNKVEIKHMAAELLAEHVTKPTIE